MKKVISILSLAMLAITSTAFAASHNNPAVSGLVFEGQISANMTPDQTFDRAENEARTLGATNTDERNLGIGGGLFVGYDFALNPHMTVGGKVGYRYLYAVNYLEFSGGGVDQADFMLNIASFPVLGTFKYFFSSGWMLGAEAGVDIQRWDVEGKDSATSVTGDHHSEWNVAPMVGVSGGYKWHNGIALTGSLSYVFGKTIDGIKVNGDNDNDALAVWSLGLNLSYTLPI